MTSDLPPSVPAPPPASTDRVFVVGAALLAALWGWLYFVMGEGLRYGRIDYPGILELLVHETPDSAWSGKIHPPGYTAFMWTFEHLGTATGIAGGYWVWMTSAVLTFTMLGVLLGVGRRRFGTPGALVLGALAVFSSEAMRPFEHYPVSAFFATLAGLALVALVEGGSRRIVWISAVLGFIAVELHLSSWFLAGPLVAALLVAFPGKRRELGAIAAVVVVAFLITSLFGLYDLVDMEDFADGNPGGATLGWCNPALFVPLLLFLVPRVTRRERSLACMALAIVVYTGITFALQEAQLADGQPYPSSLHYHYLVEALLMLSATGALVAAWRSWSGLFARALVSLGTGALVASQVARYVEGIGWLWTDRSLWRTAVAPWSWFG